MASIINADDGVISGAAGIKLSADTSGDLNIQTNGVTAISVSASQVVSFPATTGFSIASATITNLVATSATVSSGSTLNGGVVINELGADADTRIEGDTDANLFFVDASTDRIGVGTDTPARKFHVNSSEAVSARFTRGGGSAANNSLEWFDGTNGWYAGVSGSNFWGVAYNSSGAIDSAAIRLDTSGNLGLGVTPSAWFSNAKALEYQGGSLWSSATSNMFLMQNAYLNASADYIYKNTGAASYYSQGSGAHTWATVASGSAGATISAWTTAMVLDASGNLGLGTGNTNSSFGKGNGYGGNTGATASGYLDPYNGSTGNTILYNTGAFSILFGTNNTERCRVTSGGALCVGDTATTNNAKLKLKTTTASSNIAYFDCAQTDPYGLQVRYTAAAPNGTDNHFVACYDEVGSLVMRASIRSNGGLANFSANNVNLASDERLKKDISPLDSTWCKVKEMEVVNFRYKDCNEGDPLLYGVIAQQVQPIVPELVVVTQEAKEAVAAKDAVLDEEGNVLEPAVEAKEATPEYYGIREQPMYWLAIKALQEAMTRIEELEAKVAALEAK